MPINSPFVVAVDLEGFKESLSEVHVKSIYPNCSLQVFSTN